MKECINCKAQLEDDELFCHECGTKQEIQEGEALVEEVQEPEEKKCIHCGEIIEADSMFCPFCGKEQKKEVIQEIVAKVPEIVKDHLSKVLLNPGKWISTVIFPNKYPKSAFQLLSNKKDGFVINIALEKSMGEEGLIKRIMQSSYYAKFIIDDPSEDDFFAIMKLNDEEDAIKQLSGLLHDVYEQPFNGAPDYETALGEDVAVTPIVGSKGKKCIYCGETVETDSMFCPFCGKSQDIEETKIEEPQAKVEEIESKQKRSQPEESQVKEEPKVVESPKEKLKQEEPRQEDSPVEEEQTSQQGEKKKSNLLGCFLAIVGSLLIIGGIIWYFDLIQLNTDVVEEDIVKVENSDENIIEDAPKSALGFLDQFYKGEYENEDYIKKHATANVLNKLKMDCDYSDDCLATWVFSAFPAGADLNLEEGPIIRESGEKGKFKVDFVYSGYGENKPYYRNTVYLTVTELDGKYLISDYELYIDEPSNEQEIQSSLFSNGSVNLAGTVSSYKIHMVLEASENHVTGYYYYDSQGSDNRVKLDGNITENNSLKLKKYDNKGMETGYFEGTFDDKTYHGSNVNYERDSRRPFSVEIEE